MVYMCMYKPGNYNHKISEVLFYMYSRASLFVFHLLLIFVSKRPQNMELLRIVYSILGLFVEGRTYLNNINETQIQITVVI